ncbi:Malate/L-lactate dehydrogenase [Penicillium malachiteum]|uniref:Malate/L-lactate dehydrogenase n=1 Tax=Penicillium malachiteum TaxID=1324776 RepID=UPI0025481849|nr:Malate/L-lactate dehydrogenase [Penicillium malachiteum]KAJ5737894.1 Malate/L-lactate dehydrogenase [Penicillium malachiteum]
MAESSQQIHYIKPSSPEPFGHGILVGNGVFHNHATAVARYILMADLRGVDTHGSNRIPSYMKRIRQKVLDPKASPQLTQVTPVVASVDGKNVFGFVLAHMGMERAIEMAKEFGIGMVSIKYSNHFGMSAWLVDQAVNAEKIPIDWAFDNEGHMTDDPARALKGVMLPMGGPKGSALSIMMDVFSGVLSGSAFAGHVTNPHDQTTPADVGHFLVAIKPDLFMDLENFKSHRIYYPGEIEQITRDTRLKDGIPFTQAEINGLNEEAKAVGAETLNLE